MDPAAHSDDLIAESLSEYKASPHQSSTLGKSRKRKLPPTDLNPRATFPRKRSVTACQLCRIRKTKCNNDRPICSKCTELNAQCVYEGDETAAATVAPAHQILERLEYLIGLVEPSTRTAEGSQCISSNIHDALASRTKETHDINGSQPSTATAISKSDITADDEEAERSKHNYFGSGQDVLDWPVFEGKYDRRWIEALIFDPTLPCDDLSGPCASPRVTDDTIRDTYRDPRQASGVGIGVREDDVPHLVEAFLLNVHVKNPIFDPAYLRGLGRTVAEHGLSWQASSCLVVSEQVSWPIDTILANDQSSSFVLLPPSPLGSVDKRRRRLKAGHYVLTIACRPHRGTKQRSLTTQQLVSASAS